jgi:hypothetical protein
MRAIKRIMRYLVLTPNLGLWYPKDSHFDLIGYSDADYIGCKVDRKSISGTCQFLGRSLVSWSSKKQNYVALSTVEAEFVASGSCCAQLQWIRQTLKEFDYTMNQIPLLCDNESTINIAYNPCEHFRTKHRHLISFLERSCHQGGYSCLQFANIFTKPLVEKRF